MAVMLRAASGWTGEGSSLGSTSSSLEKLRDDNVQRPWKRCTELQSNSQSPRSVVQSSRAVHRALGTVYEPLVHCTEPRSNAEPLEPWLEPLERCRALGSVYTFPRTRHTAPEQCVEPQAPASSSIWVNPYLAPGRQLENRSGSCLRDLCSLLELHRGTKAALCRAGSQSPSPRSSAVLWGLWLLPPPSLGKAFSGGDGGMSGADRGPRCSLPTHNLLIQLVPLQCSSFRYF